MPSAKGGLSDGWGETSLDNRDFDIRRPLAIVINPVDRAHELGFGFVVAAGIEVARE